MLSIDKQNMPPLVSVKPPLDSTGLGAEEEITEELKMSWQITNTNNPGTAHFCRACMIGFRDRILLEDHVKHDHSDNDGYKFRCLVCQARFPRGELLREHSETCKPVRSGSALDFICHLCDKSFGQRAHLLIHYNNLHKSFDCSICAAQFASKYDLETHYETVHTLKTKKRQAEGELKELVTIACECGKVFVDEEDYKDHVQEEHPGTDPLPWPEQPDLEKAMKKKRGRPPRPPVARTPKKALPKLVRSPIAQSDSGISVQKCPECGDSFEAGADFKRHMQTVHSHLKPYSCKACGKRFTRTSDVKRHIECIHGQTVSASDMQKMHKIKPFRCNECAHLFSRYSDIKRHVEAIHAIVFTKETYTYELEEVEGSKVDVAPSNEQIKMYKCTLCQLEFRNSGHAKRHVRKVHIKNTADEFLEDIPDDKNLECSFCGDIFSTLDEKHQHVEETHKAPDDKAENNSDPYNGYDHERPPMELPSMADTDHGPLEGTPPPNLIQSNDSEQTWYKDLSSGERSMGGGQTLFDCPECKRSFTKSRFLQQHIVKMHVSKVQSKLSCSFCKRKYRYQAGLDKHMQTAHGKQVKRPRSLVRPNEAHLEDHEEEDYESEDEGYFCEPCEEEFDSRDAKLAHMNSIHSVFKCEECSKTFTTSDAWATHQLVMHSSRSGVFEGGSSGTSQPMRLNTSKTVIDLHEEDEDDESEDEKSEGEGHANESVEYS